MHFYAKNVEILDFEDYNIDIIDIDKKVDRINDLEDRNFEISYKETKSEKLK